MANYDELLYIGLARVIIVPILIELLSGYILFNGFIAIQKKGFSEI